MMIVILHFSNELILGHLEGIFSRNVELISPKCFENPSRFKSEQSSQCEVVNRI